MPVDTSSWRSEEDKDFLDRVKMVDLNRFRDSMFPRPFVESNPAIFLDSAWVDVAKLKAFLANTSGTTDLRHSLSSSIKPEPFDALSNHSQVKIELKIEAIPRTQKLLQENEQEVIELLSDSEEEEATLPDLPSAAASDWESESYSHSLPALSDGEGFTSSEMGELGANDSDSDVALDGTFNPSIFTLLSDTEWHETAITSLVVVESFKITSSLKVNRIEYLTEILSLWPILRTPTAFVLDLRHEKFKLFDKNGKLFTPDALIKNKSAEAAIHNHNARHAVVRENNARATKGRRRYWIACSGWTPSFKLNHRTTAIPDEVDEDVLALLMAGKPLSEGSDLDTTPCSRVVPPHIGGKLKHCPHPHIVNGNTVRSQIIQRQCPAKRTIYVPVDPNLQIALVTHPKMIPHNHPMPPMSKVSIEAKTTYRECIEAASTIGATVQKVDNSTSTKLLLGGKSPGEHTPALQDKRVKRSILREVKLEKNPVGLGLPGVMQLHLEDLKKPMNERYIHKIVMTDDGGTLVFTFVPSLLALIHNDEVTAFECDVTFKRAVDLNEWEMVTYLPSIQRVITIARVYTNHATTTHFVLLFDELQCLTELHTGFKIRFKRFTPGGNLLVMNADMEAAQILAAGISFLGTNDLLHSGITTEDPKEFVQYFVRVCLTHRKRAVLDFKSAVSTEDYQRLLNFPYLESEKDLDDFTLFVKNLKIKKIEDWWKHKIQSEWILPCIVRSKSQILPEHWAITPATTNMGEAQHHWTNRQSGIKLPLVEAIIFAREIDERVSEEVKLAFSTGILANKQTELFHRTSRKAQRQSAAARKAYDLEMKLDDDTVAQKTSDVESELKWKGEDITMHWKKYQDSNRDAGLQSEDHEGPHTLDVVAAVEGQIDPNVSTTPSPGLTTTNALNSESLLEFLYSSSSTGSSYHNEPDEFQPNAPMTNFDQFDFMAFQDINNLNFSGFIPVSNTLTGPSEESLDVFDPAFREVSSGLAVDSLDLHRQSEDHMYGLPLLPEPPLSLLPLLLPQVLHLREEEKRKRTRDEVDVRVILPEGSKRVKVKSARALGTDS
ncbi:hypothetical protein H0H92_001763 [Tricholoma furcatifolium]|nr:hypothetical protein H0H92_001763 [Tricholoma furcatifolium]